MNRKIPPEAFSFYYGLGPSRSYQAVAEKYDVSKRAVTDLAGRERWMARIEELERKARENSDQQIQESLEEMNERHLKTLKYIRAKALDTLKAMPLASAMDAVKALELTIKHERLIRGEPSEHTQLSVEEVTRQEIQALLVRGDGDDSHRDEPAA